MTTLYDLIDWKECMNKSLSVLSCFIYFSALNSTPIPFILKMVPADSINAVICTRKTFYNRPRTQVDDPAWNVFMNPAECASWDELDFLLAIHEISAQQDNIEPEEFVAYCSGGFLFSVLESVRLSVMQQWKLYDYPAFWLFLQSFPDYPQRIVNIYELVQSDKKCYNQLSGQAYKKICAEYQKIKAQWDEKDRIFALHTKLKQESEIPAEEIQDSSL